MLKKFGDPLWPFFGIIQVWNVVKITDFDLTLAKIYNIELVLKQNLFRSYETRGAVDSALDFLL